MPRAVTEPPVRQLVENSNRYGQRASKTAFLTSGSRLAVVRLRCKLPFVASGIVDNLRRSVPDHCGPEGQIVRRPLRETCMIWISGLCIGYEAFAHGCCKWLRAFDILRRRPDHTRSKTQIIEEEWNVHGVWGAEAAAGDWRWPIHFIHPRSALGGALRASFRLDDLARPGTKCGGRRKEDIRRRVLRIPIAVVSSDRLGLHWTQISADTLLECGGKFFPRE